MQLGSVPLSTTDDYNVAKSACATKGQPLTQPLSLVLIGGGGLLAYKLGGAPGMLIGAGVAWYIFVAASSRFEPVDESTYSLDPSGVAIHTPSRFVLGNCKRSSTW
jgi:uncharacterized oligopeptide transporter (OPT) family protein